jgi:dTDP-4-dehydrorhamnose 3,5-epimerase
MTSKIKDLQIFQPDAFEDFRGDIYTTWDVEKYPNLNWRLDKFSHSKKDVLRGLHGDFSTWKLINCLHGEFYLVVADNRPDSPTYKQWEWFILSSKNRKQVLVPPGCGNAHFVLSKECVFHYKLAFDGQYNDVENQFVIKWNSQEWNFEWPHNNPILFSRDK